MPIINEREVIKRIPIYIKGGKNKGKQGGMLIFEKDKLPYYYVVKNFKRNQLYVAPKHRNTIGISIDIIDELEKHGAEKAIFQIIGLEETSFYYIVPLKDFRKGEFTDYDDPQFRLRTSGLFRYYPTQTDISKYV